MQGQVTAAERRWTRPATVFVLIALALVLTSAAQIIYRAWLPTEGWTYDSPEDFETDAIIFVDNLLGAPSPIEPGDVLLSVEGVNLTQAMGSVSITEQFRVGDVMHYTVERDGQVLTLDVPLKRWTPAALLTFNFDTFPETISGLMTVLMLLIALFVLRQRPGEPAGWALLLLAAVLFANDLSSLVPDGPTTQVSAVLWLAAFFSYWIFGILIGPSLFLLSLTFPRPKRLLVRWPWLGVIPFTLFWIVTAFAGLQPELGFGLTGVFFLLTLLSLVHSVFTQRDAVSRAQFLWGLGGLLLAVACFSPTFVMVFAYFLGVPNSQLLFWEQLEDSGLGALAFPAFTVCLAIAILRYRLWDIEVILRRTLVYAVLTTLLALVYFGTVVVLGQVVQQLTGQRDNPLVSVISTLLIAALFVPLRRRVQGFIDRRFNRRKYDAARIIAAFGGRLRDEVALEQVTAQLAQVAGATVEPSHVSVWLPPGQ